MAGAILERELTVARARGVRFAVATHADEAGIRRLLRENATHGTISLTLEREPDYFADARIPGEAKQTIVAHLGNRVVCVGSCTIRDRFVNGRPRRVGYLGGLRLDGSAAGRSDILRRGYQFFCELQAAAPADFYFTSIAADNTRARAFLERNLPGMPRYEFIGEFVTALVRASGDTNTNHAHLEPGLSGLQLADLLNLHGQRYQFAPHWSAAQLRALEPLGLRTEDIHIRRGTHGQPACAALWDQRRFKQTVIHGYASWLALARPALNSVARFTGNPRLPKPGSALSSAFCSHLAIPEFEPPALVALLAALQTTARSRRIELVMLGFASDDPRLTTLRKHCRCREYCSRLYLVNWPGIGGSVRELDGRVLAPDVALL